MKPRSVIMLATGLLLAGCGGGGTAASLPTGAVVMRIRWPETSRLIPTAAQSVVVSLWQNQQPLNGQRAVIARPQSEYRFEGVPAGSTTIVASAHPNADGSGVAMTGGSVTVTVLASQYVSAPPIVLASTISSFALVPASIVTAPSLGPIRLGIDARNTAGELVLVSFERLVWSVNSAIVRVEELAGEPGADLYPLAEGSATVAVEDPESGFEASASVAIYSTGSAAIAIGLPFQGGAGVTVGSGPNWQAGSAGVTVGSGPNWPSGNASVSVQ